MTWPTLRLTRPAAVRLLIVGLVLLVVEAWYPFRLELPVWRPTGPERHEAGVSFGGDGDVLASAAAMPWVAEAAASGRLEVRLEARTDQADQSGPARLLAVSEDHFRADLMVGQDEDDLVVRLRRPGSDASGDPPYRVPDVFGDGRWRDLRVVVDDGDVEVSVDGGAGTAGTPGPDPLAGWDVDQRVALGDDVAGERPWRGELRRAEVTAGDGPPIDLLAPDVLEPGGDWRVRSRVAVLRQTGSQDPLLLSILRVLVFVPVGAGLRRVLRRNAPAAVAVTAVAVLLTVGKTFVATRHPSVADTVLSAAGGLAGVALMDRAIRRRRAAPRPGAEPGPPGGGDGPDGGGTLPPGPRPGPRLGQGPSDLTAPAAGNLTTPAPAHRPPTLGHATTSPSGRVRHT